MAPDAEARSEAIQRFVTLAGCSSADAEKLVDAALKAASDQLLERIRGGGSPPTNMTYLRAEELHYICLLVGRSLSQKEVSVLFRIPPSPARQVVTTMQATYEEPLRETFLARGVHAPSAGSSTRTFVGGSLQTPIVS